MIQLNVLSGRKAGTEQVVRRFPFKIGRGATVELRLQDEGIWDEHAEIHLNVARGFCLTVHPEAVAMVNGQPSQEAILRNGDELGIGSVKLRFSLSPPISRSWRRREVLTWLGLGLLGLGQIGLIYWLLE